MMDLWIDNTEKQICTPTASAKLEPTPLFIVAAIIDAENDGITVNKGDIARAIWDVTELESSHLKRFKVHLTHARKALKMVGYTFATEVPAAYNKRRGAADETRIWIVPIKPAVPD